MTKSSSFASWLSDEIHRRGWQLIDLEAESGVPDATLSRILNKGTRPSPPNVLKLAQATGTDVGDLMRLAGYPVGNVAATDADEQELLLIVRSFSWAQEMIPDVLALSPENRAIVLGIVKMMLTQQDGAAQ
jgi:transcriptional regulator with XRE-family HTH domain